LEDITRKGEYYADRQRYRRDWIKRLLKIDRILKAFNPGVDVDSVLDNTDITNCSSIQLYWKVREKRMEYNNPPKDTDVGDYIFLSGVPYADIILLENKMRNLILKADNSLKVKVFYKAADALKAIKNQAFTY
jgi:hypothetical protein